MSELRVRCPTTRRFAGRIVHRQPLDLAAVSDTQVVVRLVRAECIEPPIQTVRVELRGHYTSGFESSDFRPCGGLPPEAKAFDDSLGEAWVAFSPKLDLRRLEWPKFADTSSYPTVYVRWHGTLTGPGAYGHMGVATYQFVVDEFLELRHARPDDCR